MIVFEPQPAVSDVPARMPSPFEVDAIAPLARRAAAELLADLQRGAFAIDLGALSAPGGGKMFGVVVVAEPGAAGRIGYLRGFSGMIDGAWDIDGFVPPAFDAIAKAAVWPAGEAELAVIAARIAEARDGADAIAARASLEDVTARQAAELAALDARHAANRAHRHAARSALAAGDADRDARHALDQASRADTAERRRVVAAQADARADVAARVRAFDDSHAALEATRAARSRELLVQIYDSYVLANARGERRAMRALFAPDAPPGGAGDCAAPKLLAHAYRLGLRPVALAEVWCGAPPTTDGRHAGVFYPPCRSKCGVIVPYMLDGLAVDDAPVFGAAPIAAAEPRMLFEDRWLAIVAKPCGLLSVPGRSGRLRDSVQTRLRARYPDATGPLVVHRLDLDTSGVLVVAKDADTHAALQRLFARHEIAKRYVAWLAGELDGERGDYGEIDLPLRVDLDDRPRQIVDPAHGKHARTSWRVLARDRGRTRVELIPHTGRTHQLRVHAAHARGLGVPIAGDRLYGRAPDADRMMLHACAIAFVHPHTGERVAIEWDAPF